MIQDDPKDKEVKKADLIKFAYDLGISICIPLVLLAGLGVWIDRKFNTKTIFLISGLLLSLITTSISIKRKVNKFKL